MDSINLSNQPELFISKAVVCSFLYIFVCYNRNKVMYLLTEVESLELRRVESDVLAGWTLLCYAIHK